jgi:drug/metabolite transporter (DMT)-like permease
LLLVLAALWGGSFVFIRVAAPALGAIPLAFARTAIAAAVLLGVAIARRQVPALRLRWRDFAVVGVINSAMPFALFSFAGQHITASIAAVLNATSPFFGALAAALWLAEPLTLRRLGGMCVGIAGVALLVGWTAEPRANHAILGIGACLAAALCYALGSVYIKRRMQGVPAFAIACWSQFTAALALAPLLLFVPLPGALSTLVATNVLALAIASTAVAYLIYFRLIAEIGPGGALTVTFLIPLFGVLWGFLFLDEPVTPSLLGGGALIVAGTAIALRR